MDHVLVLRFSALGDVLMTVPVVASFARQYPDVRVTVCSRAWAKPIFDLLPKNVTFVTADLTGKHSGWKGLNQLARRLLALQPLKVADLHDVLRTKYLRTRFRLAGNPVSTIHKDRLARRRFLLAAEKTPQESVIEKYADVFRRLGYPALKVTFCGFFPEGKADLQTRLPHFDPRQRPEPYWVAIAPYATHAGKTYPLEQMEHVVATLSERGDTHLFLFGAGSEERATLERWSTMYPHTESMVGQLGGLAAEAAVISHCCVMVSMDSANMHLASLVGVPVVSIWGATHPFGGFLGYGQELSDAVQRGDLPCRPCSTYGQAPCRYGDYRCLRGLSPVLVTESVLRHLPSAPAQ